MQPGPHRRVVRLALFALSGAVVVGSLVVFGLAVEDAGPSWARNVVPVALGGHPWAPAWLGVVGGGLVLGGLVRRSPVAWAGVALLGVIGAFFFAGIGWVYLVAALLLASGLANQRPRRSRRNTEPI